MAQYYIFTVEFFSSENAYDPERTDHLIAANMLHGGPEGAKKHINRLALAIMTHDNYVGFRIKNVNTFPPKGMAEAVKTEVDIADVAEYHIEDEWDYLVTQVKKCVNGEKFKGTPTVAVMSDRICRNKRAEKFIQRYPRRSITKASKVKFINEVLDCVIESGKSPLSRYAESGDRLFVSGTKGWGHIPMNVRMREIIINALNQKARQ